MDVRFTKLKAKTTHVSRINDTYQAIQLDRHESPVKMQAREERRVDCAERQKLLHLTFSASFDPADPREACVRLSEDDLWQGLSVLKQDEQKAILSKAAQMSRGDLALLILDLQLLASERS